MEELRAQIAALSATVSVGFRHVDQRFDAIQQMSRERHAENVVRLTRIEDAAVETNGRVTKLETDADHLKEAAKDVLPTTHAIRYVVVAGGSITAFWWLMQVFGK